MGSNRDYEATISTLKQAGYKSDTTILRIITKEGDTNPELDRYTNELIYNAKSFTEAKYFVEGLYERAISEFKDDTNIKIIQTNYETIKSAVESNYYKLRQKRYQENLDSISTRITDNTLTASVDHLNATLGVLYSIQKISDSSDAQKKQAEQLITKITADYAPKYLYLENLNDNFMVLGKVVNLYDKEEEIENAFISKNVIYRTGAPGVSSSMVYTTVNIPNDWQSNPTDCYVIGKLPGYNSNIDPDGLFIQKKVQDQQRVFLTPSSYYVNIIGVISSLYNDLNVALDNYQKKKSKETDNKTDDKSNDKNKDASSHVVPYSACYLGTEAMHNLHNTWWNSKEGELIQIDTVNAWKSFSLACIGSNLRPQRYFKLMVTNESTASEAFSNSYQQNYFAQLDQKISDVFTKVRFGSAIQSFSKMLMNRSSSFLQELASKAFDMVGPIGSLLVTKLLGFKANFPQVWQDSTYNQTFTYSIKLISPRGDFDSINKYINIPLQYLQLMASPITYDGVYFGFPQVWAVSAPGQIYNTLMVVQDMQITRGGTDSITNVKGQPTSVDVRITFMPLMNTYSSYVAPVKPGQTKGFYDIFFNVKDANGNLFDESKSWKEIVGEEINVITPEAMSNASSTVKSIFGAEPYGSNFTYMKKYSDAENDQIKKGIAINNI